MEWKISLLSTRGPLNWYRNIDCNEKWQGLRPNPKVCDHEDLCEDKKNNNMEKHRRLAFPLVWPSDCLTGAASCSDANSGQRSGAAAGLHKGDGGAGEDGRGPKVSGCYKVLINSKQFCFGRCPTWSEDTSRTAHTGLRWTGRQRPIGSWCLGCRRFTPRHQEAPLQNCEGGREENCRKLNKRFTLEHQFLSSLSPRLSFWQKKKD